MQAEAEAIHSYRSANSLCKSVLVHIMLFCHKLTRARCACSFEILDSYACCLSNWRLLDKDHKIVPWVSWVQGMREKLDLSCMFRSGQFNMTLC